MKRLTLLAALVSLAALAFAGGTQEATNTADRLELTGTFKLDGGLPQLEAMGKTYALMAPGAYRWGFFPQAGSTITVTGYTVVPGPRAVRPELEHLFVEKAVVDGKTYDLTQGFARPGMAGRGRMAGRGMWGYGPYTPQ